MDPNPYLRFREGGLEKSQSYLSPIWCALYERLLCCSSSSFRIESGGRGGV
jgi:hypothetical protein